MSKRFSKIGGGALWRSKRFTGLKSNDSKLLLFYYMTSEHMTSAGAYEVPDGYVVTDLGWTLDQYWKARAELLAAELILFDDQASVVYVLRWFHHNAPMNDRHSQGTARLIGDLPSDTIREKVEADFLEADAKRNVVPLSPGSGAGLGNITSQLAARKWPVQSGGGR